MTLAFRNLEKGFERETGVGPHYNFLGLMAHMSSETFSSIKNYIV